MNDYATIRLTNVSIGYKTRRGLRTVVQGITADIRRGELTCLLGRNGAGKSTLLRTLAGFQPKLGGSITIEDGSWSHTLAASWRNGWVWC